MDTRQRSHSYRCEAGFVGTGSIADTEQTIQLQTTRKLLGAQPYIGSLGSRARS